MKVITIWIWLMSVIHVYGYKECITTGGKCKFPFTYHGTTYNICTQSGTGHRPRPWCYYDDSKNFDYCLDECFECGVSNTVQKSCNMQRGKEGALSNDDFPWNVIIKEKNSEKILCNGAIISNNRVLTTVNCVEQIRSKNINELYAGSNTKDPNNGYQKGEIESCNTHPDYNNETLENDIAIINLKTWLTWNDKVLSTCYSKNYSLVNAHQNATFTGSKIVESTDDSRKNIHYSIVHQVPNFMDHDCNKTGTFCTSKNSVDSDDKENEGGPLTILQDSKCVLVGILSKIKPDKNILVFTNISKYVEWIMKFI